MVAYAFLTGTAGPPVPKPVVAAKPKPRRAADELALMHKEFDTKKQSVMQRVEQELVRYQQQHSREDVNWGNVLTETLQGDAIWRGDLALKDSSNVGRQHATVLTCNN